LYQLSHISHVSAPARLENFVISKLSATSTLDCLYSKQNEPNEKTLSDIYEWSNFCSAFKRNLILSSCNAILWWSWARTTQCTSATLAAIIALCRRQWNLRLDL